MPVSLLMFRITKDALRQTVEARVRAADSSMQLSAASSLLDLTCDATLELDSELRLMSHSSTFAAMLGLDLRL